MNSLKVGRVELQAGFHQVIGIVNASSQHRLVRENLHIYTVSKDYADSVMQREAFRNLL